MAKKHQPEPLTIPFLTPACPFCNERTKVQITDLEFTMLTEVGPDGRQRPIQDALPTRDAAFRELVKTGNHPACWTGMFGPNPFEQEEDEEEREDYSWSEVAERGHLCPSSPKWAGPHIPDENGICRECGEYADLGMQTIDNPEGA